MGGRRILQTALLYAHLQSFGTAVFSHAALYANGTSEEESASATTVDLTTTVMSTLNSTSHVATITALPTSANGSDVPSGTGLSYAYACNYAKWRWLTNVDNETRMSVTSTETLPFTSTSANLKYSTVSATQTFLANTTAYTLCDGFPRLDGFTNLSTRVVSTAHTSVWSGASTDTLFTTTTLVPPPSCTIASSDCAALSSLWLASSSSFDAAFTQWENEATAVSFSSPPPDFTRWGPPRCGQITAPPPATSTEVGAPVCFVPEVGVNLLYWPVTKASGNLCNGSAATTPMSETIPGKANTFVTFNTTLTSPTVYINVIGTWGYTSAGTIYANQTRILLPQSPASVSSYCSHVEGHTGTLLPINYADFNYPVPAKAYRCQPKCFSPSFSSYLTLSTMPVGAVSGTGTSLYTTWGTETYSVAVNSWYPLENECSTIWNDYAPALSVPKELFAIRPVQEGDSGQCYFEANSYNLLYDPPTALTQAASAAGPSTPTSLATASTPVAQTVTAEPASSLSVPTATTTVATSSGPAATATVGSALPAETQGTASQPNAQLSGENGSVPSGTSVQNDPNTATRDPAQEPSSPADPSTASSTSTLNNGSPNSAYSSGSSEADPPQYSGQGQVPQSTATSTTALAGGIGGIIASVLGMTSSSVPQPSDPAAPQATSDAGGAGNPQDPAPSSADPAGMVVSLLGNTGGGGAAIPSTGSAPSPPAGVTSSAADRGIIVTDPNGDSQTFSSDSAGNLLFGTATLSYGQTTSLSGLGAVVAGSSGIEVSGSTVPYSSLDPNAIQTPAPVFTAAGTTITALGSSTVPLASGLLLTPGGPEVTVGDETLSLAPSGSYLVINHTLTQSPSYLSAASPVQPIQPPVITVAGQTYTADSAAEFSLHVGTTDVVLSAGGVVTISGTTISLEPSESYVVVNGVTMALGATASQAPSQATGSSSLTAQSSRPLATGLSGSQSGSASIHVASGTSAGTQGTASSSAAAAAGNFAGAGVWTVGCTFLALWMIHGLNVW
ncbi:hypothetical protein B0A55_10928 [Friedmanniomyces simplex]|uniref:Uncharacterized protein n=1 Tax=Friedmanniomyces simplex TaxID=329884 RepID=A0A4U0WNP5_9PEZI|nr:hypothetical protein B0A55_10928 [Friedmanniomyces simplex]